MITTRALEWAETWLFLKSTSFQAESFVMDYYKMIWAKKKFGGSKPSVALPKFKMAAILAKFHTIRHYKLHNFWSNPHKMMFLCYKTMFLCMGNRMGLFPNRLDQ